MKTSDNIFSLQQFVERLGGGAQLTETECMLLLVAASSVLDFNVLTRCRLDKWKENQVCIASVALFWALHSDSESISSTI